MIYDASLDELLQKVWDGRPIGQAEALRLYGLPLEELGALADRRRSPHRPATSAIRSRTSRPSDQINITSLCAK